MTHRDQKGRPAGLAPWLVACILLLCCASAVPGALGMSMTREENAAMLAAALVGVFRGVRGGAPRRGRGRGVVVPVDGPARTSTEALAPLWAHLGPGFDNRTNLNPWHAIWPELESGSRAPGARDLAATSAALLL